MPRLRLTPLRYFLTVARNSDADLVRRNKMARAAGRLGAPLWPSSRDRQRRYRQRTRDGTLMITVSITPAQTAKLAALRYLADGELESRRHIAAAIAAVLDAIDVR